MIGYVQHREDSQRLGRIDERPRTHVEGGDVGYTSRRATADRSAAPGVAVVCPGRHDERGFSGYRHADVWNGGDRRLARSGAAAPFPADRVSNAFALGDVRRARRAASLSRPRRRPLPRLDRRHRLAHRPGRRDPDRGRLRRGHAAVLELERGAADGARRSGLYLAVSAGPEARHAHFSGE